MKVSVFGAGYVGLATAACLAEMRNSVVCLDAVLLDGRNLYQPAELKAAGFEYQGIGRGAAAPSRTEIADAASPAWQRLLA